MAQCPRCKEDMPLLSKICPVCGYVAEDDEKTLSAEECVDNLETILHDLKEIPHPSFLKGMAQMSVFIYPILAISMLTVALISEGMAFWILFAILVICTIVAVSRKISGRLGNEKFDKQFRSLKNDYEYNERLARRSFGKSREVSTLLGDISAQIAEMEASRRQASRRNLLIWACVIVVLAILAASGVFSANEAVKGNDTEVVSGSWQEAVETFKASGNNNEHGDNKVRMGVLSKILDANEPAAAEEFFASCAQGCMGDYDCARMIVQYHLDKADTDAASRFINGLSLRYKSDKEKLQKMINR